MVRLAACAVVLAGCDSVFGLDDVPPFLVTGSYRQIYVTNDANFAPAVAERVYPVGTISLAATLDDGTTVDVTYAGDGTFSFPIAHEGQGYRLTYTVDGGRGEIQTNTPRLDVAGLLAGRPDRIPINVSTVQFPYPSSTATPYAAYVTSTGLYTNSYTYMFGPTVSFDWRLSSPSPAAITGLPEASKHDRLYVLETELDNSIGGMPFTTIKGASSASVTLVPSGTVTLPQPEPMSRNGCARFAVTNGADHDRIVAALPRSYVSSSADWVLYMAPAPDRLSIAGANWAALCGYSPAADIDIAPTFHDPYAGTTLVVESAAVASFQIQLPNTSPLVQHNITRRYALVERGDPASCTSAKSTMTSSAALPGNLMLDGIPLDADGKVVALDLSRDVPLTWSFVAPGRAEMYGISLLELVDVNGATTYVAKSSTFVANQMSVLLDRTLLVPGGTYIIAINMSLGRPNIASGDWVTMSWPQENTSVWSFYFEVQPR